MPAYDPNNIFAKILRGELPCYKVYEDDKAIAFLDIMPRAPGHTLVLPKAPARNLLDIGAEECGEGALPPCRCAGSRRRVRCGAAAGRRLAATVGVLPPGAGGVVGARAGAGRHEQQLIGALHADQLKPVTDVDSHRLGYYAA